MLEYVAVGLPGLQLGLSTAEACAARDLPTLERRPGPAWLATLLLALKWWAHLLTNLAGRAVAPGDLFTKAAMAALLVAPALSAHWTAYLQYSRTTV